MNNNLFPISKEAWKYIAVSLAVFIVLGVLDMDFLQFFSFLLAMFFIYIYRNPERQMPTFEKGGIISPVDGRIIDIKEHENGADIVIDSSYYDVSVLRVPIGSVVNDICEQKGASLSRNSSKSDKLNENLSLRFEYTDKKFVDVTHKSALNFAGISYDLFKSQKVVQGSRYGVMPKGITTISLPKESKLNVAIATEVKACETILGYLY